MSTSTEAANYYQDPLAIVTILVSVPLFYLFFINRDVFPLAQRGPMLVLSHMVGVIFYVCFALFQSQHPEIIFLAALLNNFICVGSVFTLLLTRLWTLYMDAGITHERANNKIGWFINHRHLRSRKFLAKMIVSQMCFHVLLFIISSALAGSRNLEPARNQGGLPVPGILAGTVAFLYCVAFVGFSIKLVPLKEGFQIKQEFRLVGVGTGIMVAGSLIHLAFRLPCEVASCGPLLYWSCGAWMLIWSIVFPLVYAFWHDSHFRWLPRLEGRNSKTMTDTKAYNGDSISDTQTRSSGASGASASGEGDAPSHPEHRSVPSLDSEGQPVAGTQHPEPRGTESGKSLSGPKLEKLQKVPLARFLATAEGKEAFRQFLVSEFSVENLMFVDAVQQLRTLPNCTMEEIDKVLDQFVIPSAPHQVNLQSHVIAKIRARLDEGGDPENLKHVFDEAHDQVMKIMSRDSFRRFQRSPVWHQQVLVFDEPV